MDQKLTNLTELFHTVLQNSHNHLPERPPEGCDRGHPPPFVPLGLNRPEDWDDRHHFDQDHREERDDRWYQDKDFNDNPWGDQNIHKCALSMNFLHFDCDNPSGWTYKVNKFFDYY